MTEMKKKRTGFRRPYMVVEKIFERVALSCDKWDMNCRGPTGIGTDKS